jgi:dihydroorotase
VVSVTETRGSGGIAIAAPANGAQGVIGSGVGSVVADLEISRAWLVDPLSGRQGPGEIVVTDGLIEAITWLEGEEAEDIDDRGIVVAPGFIDLHVHLREPGNEDAETIATGLAAAAHGGFTTVCAMPNTTPAADEPGVVARVRAAALASGSPVAVLAYGALSVGRHGETLAALGELADAGVVGFSDDGAPIRTASMLRSALLYAAMFGLSVVDHAEDPEQTAGAEASEGLVATILGLRAWPLSAEVSAVARDLAVFEDVLRDEPQARLHLTHLSTAGALDLIRGAKARGVPVTCDVTPHHVALSDEWLAGARRWAWEAPADAGGSGDPWTDGVLIAEPFDPSLRVNPPLRPVADAAACLAAVADGTADAVATDHAPHTVVDKAVEFGLAANGISGLETALGVLLAAVDAERLPLARAIATLTSGPAAVLGPRLGRGSGLVEGEPADLVVFDRADEWSVAAATLASKGTNTPLLGRSLPGRVLLTIAGGRLAYGDPGLE